MKKAIRYLIYIVSAFFLFLLIAIILVPILYKKDINSLIKNTLNENINSTISYPYEGVKLSLIKNFPDLSFEISDFTITGKAPFVYDTLLQVKTFSIALNTWDLLFDRVLHVEKTQIIDPILKVVVIDSIQNNYSIFYSDSTEVNTQTEGESFLNSINLKNVVIENGTLHYLDSLNKNYFTFRQFNKDSKIHFSNNVLDLVTEMSLEGISIQMDTTKFSTTIPIKTELNLLADMENEKYSFDKNLWSIGDMSISLQGFLLIKEDNKYDLSIDYQSANTTLESILSLLPANLKSNLQNYQIKGNLNIVGDAKGELDLDKQRYPEINLKTSISKGSVRGGKLKDKELQLSLELSVYNPNQANDFSIDVKDIQLSVDQSQFQAKGKFTHLPNATMDVMANGDIHLVDLLPFLPDSLFKAIEGRTKLDMIVKGKYDQKQKKMPNVRGNIQISKGMLHSYDYDYPINIEMSSDIEVKEGSMEKGRFDVKYLTILQGKDRMEIKGSVNNFVKQIFSLSVEGVLDLKILQPFLPKEDEMVLEGNIATKLTTTGEGSQLKNKQFNTLVFQGKMDVSNFLFYSKEYPQKIKIQKANTLINKEKIQIVSANGFLGRSDFSAKGFFSNYFNYALEDKGNVLVAHMDIKSNRFFTNEWMEEETEQEAKKEPNPQDAIPVKIPLDIQLTSKMEVNQLFYTPFEFTDFKAMMKIKKGILTFEDMQTVFIGAKLLGDFSLDTKPDKPVFDSRLDLLGLALGKGFEELSIIRKLFPMSENADGKLSADVQLKGILTADFSPIYETFFGGGNMETDGVVFKEVKAFQLLSNVTGIKELSSPKIKNSKLQFHIEKGTVNLVPFSTQIADIAVDVKGKSTINGKIDFDLDMQIPTDRIKSIAGFVGQFTGGQPIPMSFKITGDAINPKVKMMPLSSNKNKKKKSMKLLENIGKGLLGFPKKKKND